VKVGNVRFTPESGHCLTAIAMSALCQKQTSCSATDCSLFDHFVGVGEAEIDRELKLGWQLNSVLVPNYCQSHVLNSSYRNGPRMLAQIREHRVRHLESGETM